MLLFFARFKFSDPMKHHVGTLYRTLPGVLVFFFIGGLVSITWSMGYWLQFGGRMKSMSTFLACFTIFSSTNIIEDPEFFSSTTDGSF